MTKQLEALIASEIADFFAGVAEIHTAPGGPDTVEEAQQQLTERVTRIASDCEAAMIAALEQKEEQRANWFQMAQKLGEDMDAAEKRIAELEAIRAAAEKLVRCKGRYHSEQNYRALAALFGVNTPDLPPLEGEASPLAVKLHKRSVGEVMHMSGFSRDYAEGWCAGNDNAIHEIRAAGGTVSEGE